jgi:hypothetical protein
MGDGIVQTKGKDYDHSSIMQYSSTVYVKDVEGGVADMPLLRWKNGRPESGEKPHDKNVKLTMDPVGISIGDHAAIKRLYPWVN